MLLHRTKARSGMGEHANSTQWPIVTVHRNQVSTRTVCSNMDVFYSMGMTNHLHTTSTWEG
jgi:hypothetical protein